MVLRRISGQKFKPVPPVEVGAEAALERAPVLVQGLEGSAQRQEVACSPPETELGRGPECGDSEGHVGERETSLILAQRAAVPTDAVGSGPTCLHTSLPANPSSFSFSVVGREERGGAPSPSNESVGSASGSCWEGPVPLLWGWVLQIEEGQGGLAGWLSGLGHIQEATMDA